MATVTSARQIQYRGIFCRDMLTFTDIMAVIRNLENLCSTSKIVPKFRMSQEETAVEILWEVWTGKRLDEKQLTDVPQRLRSIANIHAITSDPKEILKNVHVWKSVVSNTVARENVCSNLKIVLKCRMSLEETDVEILWEVWAGKRHEAIQLTKVPQRLRSIAKNTSFLQIRRKSWKFYLSETLQFSSQDRRVERFHFSLHQIKGSSEVCRSRNTLVSFASLRVSFKYYYSSQSHGNKFSIMVYL